MNEDRRIFIPTISKIMEKYGKNLKIYGRYSGNFNDQIWNWQSIVLNATVNYLSKTEGEIYVSVVNDVDSLFFSDVIVVSHFSNILQEEKDRLNSYLVRNNFVETFQRQGLSIYERNRSGKEREE